MRAAILMVLFLSFLGQSVLAEDVMFQIRGLRNQKGSVHMYAFDTKEREGFPKNWGQSACHAQGKAQGSAIDLRCDLKLPGQFAIFAYHDENQNGAMDHNFFFLPLEGYGFSSGAKGRFGPPDFSAAAIVLIAAGEVQVIKIEYYFDAD